MTYGIIGLGGIGGYYGGLLARAGLEVHFLVRSGATHLREHGLRVDSVDGNYQVPDVRVHERAEDMPVCDVVLVCLKATDNAVLERILPRVLAPGGTVVLLQNGLGVEPWLQSIVPGATVIGGLCFIASSKVGVGHIRHQDYGRVTLGQFAADYAPCGITPCLAQLADAFTAAGIETVTSTDLRDARWRKLVWNIPFNGLSAILRLTTAELLGRAPARGLVCELMAEVLAGAAACGAPIEAAFIDRMIEMTERIAPYKPSMLLDAEAGRPMEVEAIYGAPVRYAQRAGVEMRLTHCLALQLAALASAS